MSSYDLIDDLFKGLKWDIDSDMTETNGLNPVNVNPRVLPDTGSSSHDQGNQSGAQKARARMIERQTGKPEGGEGHGNDSEKG